MPENKCVYTDTDSVVLEHKLSEQFIGKEIGQMKLEHTIQHGIFIRKKLYAIKNENNEIIIKSAGVDPLKLAWYQFYILKSGKTVELKRTQFKVDWKNLQVEIEEKDIVLQGIKLVEELNLTLYNPNLFAIVPYEGQSRTWADLASVYITDKELLELIDLAQGEAGEALMKEFKKRKASALEAYNYNIGKTGDA